MQLPKYIEELGVGKMADLHGVTVTTARAWLNLEWVPDPAKANEIIEKSNGLVSWAEIYEPFFAAKKNTASSAA